MQPMRQLRQSLLLVVAVAVALVNRTQILWVLRTGRWCRRQRPMRLLRQRLRATHCLAPTLRISVRFKGLMTTVCSCPKVLRHASLRRRHKMLRVPTFLGFGRRMEVPYLIPMTAVGFTYRMPRVAAKAALAQSGLTRVETSRTPTPFVRIPDVIAQVALLRGGPGSRAKKWQMAIPMNAMSRVRQRRPSAKRWGSLITKPRQSTQTRASCTKPKTDRMEIFIGLPRRPFGWPVAKISWRRRRPGAISTTTPIKGRPGGRLDLMTRAGLPEPVNLGLTKATRRR